MSLRLVRNFETIAAVVVAGVLVMAVFFQTATVAAQEVLPRPEASE